MTGPYTGPVSDPWLSPPTAADRDLVEPLGGVVDEQIAGAA